MSAVSRGAEDSRDGADGSDSAAPLDLLLGDAARSPLRRFLPGMSGVRFAASLARHPGRVAGRTPRPGRRAGADRRWAAPRWHRTRRTAASPTRAGRATRCCAAPLQSYLAAGAGGARAGRGRRPRLGRRPADELHRRQPRRGVVAQQQPVPQPQGAQADRSTPAAATSSRAADGSSATSRRAPRVPSMVEPDAFEVGADIAVTPGRGGAAHRRVRADPVHPADHQGPLRTTADRAADDQQVLRHRPRRAAQPRRAPGRERAAGLLHLLAQPRRPARRLGPRHLRRRRSSRRWTPRRRSRGRTRWRCSRSAPAACSPRWCSATSPRPATSAGWRRSASRSPCSTRRRPGLPERAAVAQGGGRLDQGLAGEGLPRRPDAGRGVRLAAAQRPDLELLGQQLPAGPRAQGVRHPLLERRPGADDRGDAPRLHGARDQQRAHRSPAASRMLGTDIDLGKVDTDTYVVAGIADHLCAWESCYPPPSCSAATPSSCSPPAGTSPRW